MILHATYMQVGPGFLMCTEMYTYNFRNEKQKKEPSIVWDTASRDAYKDLWYSVNITMI